jgi:hypothetical protein
LRFDRITSATVCNRCFSATGFSRKAAAPSSTILLASSLKLYPEVCAAPTFGSYNGQAGRDD